MNITDSWAQQSRNHGNDDDNQSIAKTTVWNKGECFYISTLNRESSAAISPPMRYNETIAWECDRSGSVRGAIVGMGEAPSGSLKTHQRIVKQLFDYGEVRIDEETAEIANLKAEREELRQCLEAFLTTKRDNAHWIDRAMAILSK